jgi:tRNA pseudouridine55 synthase
MASIDGVLVVDKPAGPTSHDVVARVRRALKTPRVGHTGTLDPLATGVLPVVVGRATRLASFLSGDEKEYVAGIRLGLATETYDAASREAVPPPPAAVTTDLVQEALTRFRGTFDQSPPPYSAKKLGGVRAYKLARSSTPVQPEPVSVTVHQLVLERYGEGLLMLRVRASAGFYVRSLAHDLGRVLGCGGHLETLRRVKAASFTEEMAVPLDRIEHDGLDAARWLVPLDQLLQEIPGVVLSDRGLKRAVHGNHLSPEDASPPVVSPGVVRYRLIDAAGHLIGIAEPRGGGLLHPVIVLV